MLFQELGTLENMMAEAHSAKFAVAFASGSATYHALLDQPLGSHQYLTHKVGGCEELAKWHHPVSRAPCNFV